MGQLVAENETRAVLAQGLRLMGITLAQEDQAMARLAVYFRELKKWNRKYNLVAARSTDQDILEKHFLDSLTIIPLIYQPDSSYDQAAGQSLLDVGTGAGFPGLVVKAALPELAVTLVEPRQKRVSFLKHIIRTLGLAGVEVVCGRLGEKGTGTTAGSPAEFAIITCRALTDTASFLAMAAPYLAPHGRIICMKGPQGLEEARDFAQGEGADSPLRLREIRELRLPFSKAERVLLIFESKTEH